MKKLLTAKYLPLLMLLSLLGGSAQAGRYEDNGYQVNDGGCCPSYECSCNPLYCGAWDLQIHGGVNPILWRHRGPFSFVDCSPVPPATGPLVALFDPFPKFRTFYKTPWIVGGQVGWAMSDNTRVYLELNYSHARGKTDVAPVQTFVPAAGTPLPFIFNLSKYKIFDGYVGVRYYWDRWCDRVSFFLGGKVGFTHHKSVTSGFDFVTPVPATPTLSAVIFTKSTVVSGGADFGLDICFCGNWSIVIQGAVIASCGPRPADNIIVPPALGLAFTNFVVGHIGTELRFPVTAGIRYSF